MPAVGHHEQRVELRRFADEHIAPHAARADREAVLAPEVISALAGAGYLGGVVGEEHGGAGFDERTFGVFCEEVGRACTAARSLVTVQSMVARTIDRWGTREQRDRWLPALATGDAIAAFCLTEPDVGSDAKAVATALVPAGGGAFAASGRKRWVTFGARADIFLVLGRSPDGPTAFLVERDARGLSTSPITGQLGLRGAMLADVSLDGVDVAPDAVIGKAGWGFSHVVATTLDHGRHSVAWGCVGMGQAALDAAVSYALEREQFGTPIAEHQLVRALVADMLVSVRAARLACEEAARLRDARDPRAIQATMVAKYQAARMVAAVTPDAVQVLGANGVDPQYGVERHYRDAKIMQIIEGSDQLLQLAISDFAYREARASEAP